MTIRSTCKLAPAFFAALFACMPAVAQQSATQPATTQPAPLSLQDCINVAMKNQVDVLTARGNVDVAKSQVSQSMGAYFPQVTVQSNAFVAGTKGVLNTTSNGTAISISENIFDGGLREANVKSARYGVKANDAALNRTMQTTAFNVTQAYYGLLRSKHLADVADANVKYNQTLRDQVLAQVKAGAAAQVDVLPVEAQLASAQVSLLTAQNAVQTSAIALESTMGLSPQPGFDIKDVTAEPQIKLQPLNTYISTAMASRPDIAQRQADVGSAKAAQRAAGINLFPRPVISANYQHSVYGGFANSSQQLVGGIIFDVFDGGANLAAYKGAKATRKIADQQAQQVVKDVKSQVEQAYVDLTSAQQQVSASEVGLTAAQKNYDVQRARYGQGLAITLDLLNAEVQLVTAQNNLVESNYNYYVAIAQLDYAVGKQGGFNAK